MGLGVDGVEDVGFFVGDVEDLFGHVAFEEDADGFFELLDIVVVSGGDEEGFGEFELEGFSLLFVESVAFVEDEEAFLVRADLGEDLACDIELFAEIGIGGIDEMEDQSGVAGFIEGGAEGGDEVVGELFDKADGIGDEDAWFGFGLHDTDGGIEGGEELIGDVEVAACEGAHHGGFAGVGVTDKGDVLGIEASLSALFLVFGDGGELALEFGDAVADASSVKLVGAFACAFCADAAALSVADAASEAKARCVVGEFGDLDLEAGFATAGVAGKDLDNDACSVEDFGINGFEKIVELSGGDIVVDDQDDLALFFEGRGGDLAVFYPLAVVAVFVAFFEFIE